MVKPKQIAENLPNPDPSSLTTDQIDKAIKNTEEKIRLKFDVLTARMDAAAEAVIVLHDDFVRVPTAVDRAVSNLENLVNERITGKMELVTEKIKSLGDVTTQQFSSITNTFLEKDKAVSVGLSAQKESAAAQQTANTDATEKMESNFTKLLDQGRDLLDEVRRNTDIQINDIKSRLDKGEGKQSVSDPATMAQITELMRTVSNLKNTEQVSVGRSKGMGEIWGYILGGVGAVALIVEIAIKISTH